MYKFLVLLLLVSSQLYSQEYGILFTKQKNNNDNIFLLEKDGKIKQITNHNRKDSSPMLSPDGKFMVFTSERVGWWKIWLLDLEKNSFKQLTNSSSAEYGPYWSPDGNKIVFVSGRDGNDDIYVMDKDGSNIKNISKNDHSNTQPFWGKDNRIYYSSKINGIYQIVSCKPDGSNQEIITKGEGNKLMPQLSKDSKRILYYGDIDGNMDIFIMNVKTKSISRLTEHPLMDIRPRWSPSEKSIVFERGNKGDNHHIYVMDLKSRKVKQLTFKNYNYAPSFITNKLNLFNH